MTSQVLMPTNTTIILTAAVSDGDDDADDGGGGGRWANTHPAAAAVMLPEPTGERTSAPESTGKPEGRRELHTEPAAPADSTHSHCWDTL